MNITERSFAKAVLDSLTAVNADAPKAVVDAYQRAERITAGAGSLAAPEGALAVAVVNALDAGREPATDPEVIRVVIGNSLANEYVRTAVPNLAYGPLRDACTAHADAIVTAWRKPFDLAANTLVDAHQRMPGVTDLDDTSAVVAIGGDAAEVWSAAKTAEQTITTIANGWKALGSFTRRHDTNGPHAVLLLVPADFTAYTRHELHGARLTPWELVVRGLPLRLPTFSAYAHDVATIARAQEAEAAAGVVDRARSHIAGREIRTPAA